MQRVLTRLYVAAMAKSYPLIVACRFAGVVEMLCIGDECCCLVCLPRHVLLPLLRLIFSCF